MTAPAWAMAAVIMMFTSNNTLDEATEYLDDMGTVWEFGYMVYLGVAAIIFTVLAFFIVRMISANEGRKEFFVNIPRCRKQGYKLITIPLVIAMAISLIYMVFYTTLT